jgi:hypothetical protein
MLDQVVLVGWEKNIDPAETAAKILSDRRAGLEH